MLRQNGCPNGGVEGGQTGRNGGTTRMGSEVCFVGLRNRGRNRSGCGRDIKGKPRMGTRTWLFPRVPCVFWNADSNM